MKLRFNYKYGFYFLLMVSPLLPDKIGLVPIYSFITCFIFSQRVFDSPRLQINKGSKITLVLTIAFFLFFLVSVLWGNDLILGIKAVEKKVLFVILPMMFLIFGRGRNDIGKSLFYYRVSINVALFVCLLIAFYYALDHTNFQTWPFKYYNFTYSIHIHPGYFSLLILLSLVTTVFELSERNWKGIAIWSSLIFQVFMLVFIGAKYAMVSLCITVISFIFLLKINKKQLVSLLMSLVFIFTLALLTSKNSIKRIQAVNDSVHIRTELYQAGINVFKKKPLIGYGAGNVDESLKEEYMRLNFKRAHKENYNIHNQYLQTLLSVGIIGFIPLISSIVAALIFSDKKKYVYLIMLQFLIFFSVESVLVRQKGIVAFITWLIFVSIYDYEEVFTQNQASKSS